MTPREPRTRAVNVKYAHYDVHIGRAGHGERGEFGNKYTLKKYTRAESLILFEQDFLERTVTDVNFRACVLALRGKVLGCHCHGPDWDTWSWKRLGVSHRHGNVKIFAYCHGDIISEYVEHGWPDGHWWLSAVGRKGTMTFSVEIQDGAFVQMAPIVRRFQWNGPGSLIEWLSTMKGFQFRRL